MCPCGPGRCAAVPKCRIAWKLSERRAGCSHSLPHSTRQGSGPPGRTEGSRGRPPVKASISTGTRSGDAARAGGDPHRDRPETPLPCPWPTCISGTARAAVTVHACGITLSAGRSAAITAASVWARHRGRLGSLQSRNQWEGPMMSVFRDPPPAENSCGAVLNPGTVRVTACFASSRRCVGACGCA